MQDCLLHNFRRKTLIAALLGVAIGAAPASAATTLAIVGDYGEPSLGADLVAAMVGSEAWETDYVISAGDNNSGSVAIGNPDWET